MSKFSIMVEFMDFIKERKKFILVPIMVIFFVLSFVIVATQSSAIAPFIYTLF